MVFQDPRKVCDQVKFRPKHIYDGTTKTLFDDVYDDSLVLHFKDDYLKEEDKLSKTVANKPTDLVPGKGVINNRLSEMFFSRLTELNIQNHFIERLNMREQRVRAASPLSFKVMVHNIAAGDFAYRMNLPEGTILAEPVVEFIHKVKDGSYTVLSESHLDAFKFATEEDLDIIYTDSKRVNDFLRGQFLSVDIRVMSFYLEFGRRYFADLFEFDSDLMLIDELTPDSMNLMDLRTGVRLDRSVLFTSTENPYQEVASRFRLLADGGPEDIKQGRIQ